MTQPTIIRLLLMGFVSILIGSSVHMKHHENYDYQKEAPLSSVAPAICNWYFPTLVLFIFAFMMLHFGFQTASEKMLTTWFGDFVQLGIYYVLLLLFLPNLRSHISARACALLWILPNYLFFMGRLYLEHAMPFLVIHAPIQLIWTLFYIWVTVFFAIIVWNIISHFLFRHWLLQNSTPITDPNILTLWNKEFEYTGITKPKCRLVTSPQAATPISIGLTRWTIRVVLPERSYTHEELTFIFRHELIHICREDAWSKFFLMFCNAMFWFNPFMWISRRRCSEDLELSCDEIVLLDCDDAARQKYASLILDIAGEERGFTTCLSASATAMRYRLQNIVKPKKKFSGAFTVGIVFFLLLITNGGISLAYSSSTGYELIYQSRESESFEVRHITVADSPYQTEYHCMDPDALHNYLSNLILEEITGEYTYTEGERELTIHYDSPEGILSLILYDKAIKIVPIYKRGAGSKYYYLPKGTDWEYLDSIIMAYPALNLNIHISGNSYSKGLGASLWTLTKTERGETTLLLEHTHPLETPSGMIGYEADEAILDFSHTPVSDFTITVEAWDGSPNYTISGSSLETPMVLPLANYPARYIICGEFLGYNGIVYDAEFRFDFGEMDE